jgi:3-hydroxybutyryl-CoA dehydrogenase
MFVRLNAWPGFFERSVLEGSYRDELAEVVKTIFQKLEWKYQLVPDVPGMIAARVISMIVNEAYFALEDEVSTKEEIDIAMKLGTNYPYGPFEWSKKIGLDNIQRLLSNLAETDTSYTPSALLIKEVIK